MDKDKKEILPAGLLKNPAALIIMVLLLIFFILILLPQSFWVGISMKFFK